MDSLIVLFIRQIQKQEKGERKGILIVVLQERERERGGVA